MLNRIAGLLFVACLCVAPVSVFLYVVDFADWMLYPALISISIILALTGFGFMQAYKKLTAPPPIADQNADATTKNDMPHWKETRKWHLLTTRLTLGLMIFGVLFSAAGFIGNALPMFLLSFACIIAGLIISVMSAQGTFERMDNKRNDKLYPKPPRQPVPPLPKLPKPEECPGYQYSFEF